LGGSRLAFDLCVCTFASAFVNRPLCSSSASSRRIFRFVSRFCILRSHVELALRVCKLRLYSAFARRFFLDLGRGLLSSSTHGCSGDVCTMLRSRSVFMCFMCVSSLCFGFVSIRCLKVELLRVFVGLEVLGSSSPLHHLDAGCCTLNEVRCMRLRTQLPSCGDCFELSMWRMLFDFERHLSTSHVAFDFHTCPSRLLFDFARCICVMHLHFVFACCTLAFRICILLFASCCCIGASSLRVCTSRSRFTSARHARIPHLLRRSRASYVARSDAFLHVAFALCASCSGYACCSRANLRRVQFAAPTYRRSLSCLWGASFPRNNYSATSQTASRELYLTWWSSFFFCKEKKVSLRVASCSHV